MVSGKGQRELSSSGVSNYRNALGVDWIMARKLSQQLVARCDIFKTAGPAPSWISYPPILDIEGDKSRFGQPCAEKAGMLQIVTSAPEATMDKHRCRKWTSTVWDTQIAELELVMSVAEASV